MQAAGRPPLVVPSSQVPPIIVQLGWPRAGLRSFDPGVGVTASASQRERARWSVLTVTGSRCSAQPIRSAAHVVAWVRATGTEPGAADSGLPGKTLRNRAEPWISSSPRLFKWVLNYARRPDPCLRARSRDSRLRAPSTGYVNVT